MIVLLVHWEANAGKEGEVANIFSKLAAESRKEAGCRQYVVHRHKEMPRHFMIYEAYDDEAALQAHRDSQHFRQYAASELPKLGNRLDGNLYIPMD